MRYFILIICLLFMLSSCSRRQFPRSSSDLSRDSSWVITHITQHDSTIDVKGDSASLTITKEDLKPEVLSKRALARKSGRATASLSYNPQDSTYRLQANCDPLEVKIKWLEKQVQAYKERSQSKSKVEVQQVIKIPFIYKVLSAIGGLVLLFFAVKGVLYIIKKRFTL